jgi:hypothetical protein
MQRAVSYLSGFLSEFDYGDPDHDLASFSPEDRGAQREESEELDSSNSEEVFAPDVFALHVSGPSDTHRRMVKQEPCIADQTEENWFMADGSRHSTKLMVIGRDSPCPTAHEVEEETQWPPSSRSADGQSPMRGIESMPRSTWESMPRSTWLSWLRQRWSPLKEENIVLVELEGSYAQCLLERYLTEQTRMHQVAQAELIKRETQHEDGRLDDESLHDTHCHGGDGGPVGEDRGGLREDDGGRGASRDDSFSHNCAGDDTPHTWHGGGGGPAGEDRGGVRDDDGGRGASRDDSLSHNCAGDDTPHTWHGGGGGPASEDRGGVRDDDGGRGASRDDSLSHNCGETSPSDVEDAKPQKPQRPSPLSEASTTKMNMSTTRLNMCSMSLVKKTKMLGVDTPVRGGMDGDGLEELWQASKDYVDLWTQHHKRAEKAGRGGCNTQ